MGKTYKDQDKTRMPRKGYYNRKNKRQFKNQWKHLDWQQLDKDNYLEYEIAGIEE